MQRHCKAHSYDLLTRWNALGAFYLRHVPTILLLSNHCDHSLLPNDIHVEAQRVLSDILHASNESGWAVIQTIHRLEARLEVSHIT
jgi:hypothetical protein